MHRKLEPPYKPTIVSASLVNLLPTTTTTLLTKQHQQQPYRHTNIATTTSPQQNHQQRYNNNTNKNNAISTSTTSTATPPSQVDEADVSQFDSKFTKQTPIDSPDDARLSESHNQLFMVCPPYLSLFCLLLLFYFFISSLLFFLFLFFHLFSPSPSFLLPPFSFIHRTFNFSFTHLPIINHSIAFQSFTDVATTTHALTHHS